ncbi:hypothetical protein HN924_00070 [Candidatus Woesearchaeota archaeon]|mgnify:CR=1|jgi:hypothetical protein|nr:hypothetical protein [Candidatus Woesearchaeota archaeon]MBT7062346.1 hypothetical protein [Candidatus Woesearchaeota archaeon]MBT7403147.1 hypothetical protein [Candidatus Woesearchaeota archaeon]
MVSCQRCKSKSLDDSNYCYFCGAPLKLEILEMVREDYEKKRREAVHNVLDVLVKQGCINQDKLEGLMKKLENVFDKLKRKSVSE